MSKIKELFSKKDNAKKDEKKSAGGKDTSVFKSIEEAQERFNPENEIIIQRGRKKFEVINIDESTALIKTDDGNLRLFNSKKEASGFAKDNNINGFQVFQSGEQYFIELDKDYDTPLRRVMGWINTFIIMVLIFSPLSLITAQQSGEDVYLFNHKLIHVLSDSMEPTLMTDSTPIVRRVGDSYDIQKEDVIVFKKNDMNFIHRVVGVVDNGKSYITKGDNAEVDAVPVERHEIKAVLVKPMNWTAGIVKALRPLRNAMTVMFEKILGGIPGDPSTKSEFAKTAVVGIIVATIISFLSLLKAALQYIFARDKKK